VIVPAKEMAYVKKEVRVGDSGMGRRGDGGV